MQGVYNFSVEVGKTEAVEQEEFRRLDRRRAWRIIMNSAIIGIIVAVVAYYLPL